MRADAGESLAAQVRDALTRTRARERLLVAVSGGADSIALLHLLRFGGAAGDATLLAVHFDHGMRPESHADAAWVRGVCAAWEVPLAAGASPRCLPGETAAREARWRFVLATAAELRVSAIVTAHHMDDQAETVLHRLARGTGLRGLGGIPPVRTVRIRGRTVELRRPLLEVRRGTLRAYCAAHRIGWREDPTNVLGGTPRNRIRALVLPRLEARRPGATVRLARIARLARALESVWEILLRDVTEAVVLERTPTRVTLAREVLLGYDPHVRTRVLRQELRRLGPLPGRTGTRAVDHFISSGTSGKDVTLSRGVQVRRERGRIVLQRTAPASPDRPLYIPGPDAGAGTAVLGGRAIRARWGPGPGPHGADTVVVDPTALTFPLELRAWRPGDRIQLGYGGKKLKKLFLERGIERGERDRLPVLADAGGRVVWIRGVVRAHGLGPAEGTPGFHITAADA